MILATGRLTDQKKFSTLIEAFAILRAQRECRLAILGEGELRASLEALVAERGLAPDVLLPGFVANPFAWMRQASLFVLSSAWEGLPTVLIEAMACGVPVVTTDCPSGPREILEDGRWGRLVPVGDASALAIAISGALDEKIRPNVSLRASDCEVDKAARQYLSLMASSNG